MNNNIALQSSVFPEKHHRDISALYFLSDNVSGCYPDTDSIKVLKNKEICFDTFYNSFDLYKWSKYTTVKQLGFKIDVAGRGIASIYLKVDGVLTTIFQNEIDGPFTIENLQISEWSVGRLYFQWSAIDDSEIRNFAFTTSGEVADFGKLASSLLIIVKQHYYRRYQDLSEHSLAIVFTSQNLMCMLLTMVVIWTLSPDQMLPI